MSVAWISTYEEQKKRAVSFVTTEDPAKWMKAIKKLVYCCEVYEVELFRSNRTGVTCYDLCIFVNYNLMDSEEQTLAKLFGHDFLRDILPLKTPQEKGVFSKCFVRVGASKERSKIENQPIKPDDLFTIYDTIEYSNQLNTAGYAACHQEFLKNTDINTSEIWEKKNYQYFNNLGKSHKLEGGSWLVMPKFRMEEEPQRLTQRCRRYYELIVEQFLVGHLRHDFITRVTYSTFKALVKVTNKKTIYFDYLDIHPDKNSENDEEIFREDREVNKTFLALQKCDLPHATMKYKPDVFTACKLNVKNTNSRLTLYTTILYPRKMEIAREEE